MKEIRDKNGTTGITALFKSQQWMSRNDFTFDRFRLAHDEWEIFITFKSIRFSPFIHVTQLYEFIIQDVHHGVMISDHNRVQDFRDCPSPW